MNLNEHVMNRKTKHKMTAVDHRIVKKPLSVPGKKHSATFSSDTMWGKSHISVPNSSNSKKSTSSKISSEETDSRVIVALTEGRGEARFEVGIAAISVSTPLLILCQISDTQSYVNTLTKINIFNPSEIILPKTIMDHFAGSRLVDKVRQRFPHVKYVGVPRSTFNKVNGLEMLNHLCVPYLNGIMLVLQHRYYALAASSALLKYIQDSAFIFYAAGSIKIDYQESEGYAIIDVSTADRLELVCSTKPAQGNKYASLFGVLNHCQTRIGARKLRSIILQPPCDVEIITERLDCVDELVQQPEALTAIQVLLQKISNVDSLLSIGTLISTDPDKYSARQLNYMLLLNSLLELIAPLKERLSALSQPFFAKLRNTLEHETFDDIKNVIRETINENAYSAKGQTGILQRCFAIKPGINGLLDLVRKTYTERLGDMKDYVKVLADKYDLALTLGNNQKKGYHIVLSLNSVQRKTMKKSDLPEEFIEIHQSVGSFTMKTPELVNLSTRLDDIMSDILKISDVMVQSLIVQVKNHVYLFYTLCEEIALLDVLQSLAQASAISGYTRPTFGAYTEIIHSQHPLLDFLLPTKPVSNSVICSDDYNIHIITGPNGSGKSIFIRQVLLLQVMAQVGCYIPAQSAVLKPADRIYARINLDDNMEYGASSFILEMTEMKYIMTTMTDNSLIIIDELGRSTSLEEGTALAIAILEELANSSSYIYITSHFTLLTKLHDMYPNIKLWQMETIPLGDNPKSFKLNYKFALVPGVTSIGRYGVNLVRNLWSDNILNYVDKLMDEISKQRHDSTFVTLDKKSRLKYDVEAQFRRLKLDGKLSVVKINEILNEYRCGLLELGYNINFNKLPRVDSPFDDDCTMDDNDILEAETRMKLFTPEVATGASGFPLNTNGILPGIPKRPGPNNSCCFGRFDSFPESMIEDRSDNFPVASESATSLEEIPQDASLVKIESGFSWAQPDTEVVKTSTPVAQYFNAVCCYSPSSQNSSNFSRKMEQKKNATLASWGSSKNSDDSIRSFKNERFGLNASSTPKAVEGRYKHYVSPVVRVVEGMNDTSLSWEEEERQITGKTTKINIIDDVVIRKGCERVPEDLVSDDANFGNISSKNGTIPSEADQKNRIFDGNSESKSNTKWVASLSDRNMSLPDSHTDTNDIDGFSGGFKKQYLDGSEINDRQSVKYNVATDLTSSKSSTQWIAPPFDKNNVRISERDTSKSVMNFSDDSSNTERNDYQPINTKIIANIPSIESNTECWVAPLFGKNNISISNRDITKTNMNVTDVTSNDVNLHKQNQNSYETNEFQLVNTKMAANVNSCQSNTQWIAPSYGKHNISISDRNISKANIIITDDSSNAVDMSAVLHKQNRISYETNEYQPVNAKMAANVPSIESNTEWVAPSIEKNHISDRDISKTNINITSDSSNYVNIPAVFHEQNRDSHETNEYQLVETKMTDNVPSRKSNTQWKESSFFENNISPANDISKTVTENSDDRSIAVHLSAGLQKQNRDGYETIDRPSEINMAGNVPSSESNGDTSRKQCSSTSVSSASKKRNLDEVSSASTTNKTDDSENKKHHDESFEKNDTFGDIATKQNDFKDGSCDLMLDNSARKENVESASQAEGHDKTSFISSGVTFGRHPSCLSSGSSFTASSKNVAESHRKGAIKRTIIPKNKFVPPRKLSAREIREEFQEQDRRMLECDMNSPTMSKYLKQMINRPTVKQIRNSNQLAVVRKHSHGLQVIPSYEEKKKKRRRYSPPKRHRSNESFNMSIFSDKNAKSFEEYLNSDEKDYETFRSNRNLSCEPFVSSSSIVGQTFKFALGKKNIAGKEGVAEDGRIQCEKVETFSLNFSRVTSVQSPRPRALFEESCIDGIINKYLQTKSFGGSQEYPSQRRSGEKRNIFDCSNFSNEDLSL